MKTSLDCIPCMIRQSLEAARMVSSNTAVHEQIIRDILPWIEEMNFDQSPPELVQRIHRRLHEITGEDDPYREAKDRLNSLAMDMYDELRLAINSSTDPLLTAVRFAIFGNVIDMGVSGDITGSNLHKSFDQLFSEPYFIEMDTFRREVNQASSILYLIDNAGEIAFDKLLIERLLPKQVIAVVRGAPVLNDATYRDAQAVGLDKLVQVVDNGSDAPGTILRDCSEDFSFLL